VSIVGTSVGRYRILGELSSGGMGEVYRAQHELLGKPVAMKLLRPELTGDPQQVTRFLNEAKAASAIQHPGIIRVDDFGTTEDGRSYLVMEFLEGETLTTRIRRLGKLDDREATLLASGIAGALQAAHARGIYHRDLKPDNVFLVRDPDAPLGVRPKILDFGIAKLTDVTGQTQTGTLIGTPLYMAPEQARSAAHVDHRADLYSLGCILYEMVAGQPPFLAAGAGELIALHMFEAPAPPREHAPAISPDLERIVLRLLEKEPDDRYRSAADVVSALAGASAATEKKPANKTPAKKTLRRTSALIAPATPAPNRLPLIAGGILVAIVGVVAVLVTRSSSPHKPVATPAPAPAVVVDKPAPAPVEQPSVEQPVVETPAVASPKKTQRARPVKTVTPAPDKQHTKTGSPIELTP
jgi:serine/threonine-protein kinase